MRIFLLTSAISAVTLLANHSDTAFAQETTTFEYDAQGRLLSSSRTGGPASGYNRRQCYDAAGNRTNQNVAMGSQPACPPPPPPANQPPKPDNLQTLTLQPCGTGVANVLVGDTDPEGHYPLTVQSVNAPTGLIASVVGTDSVSVTALPGASGLFIVNYVVADSQDAIATGDLPVTVNAGSCF